MSDHRLVRLGTVLTLIAVAIVGGCSHGRPNGESLTVCGVKLQLAQGYVIDTEFDEDGYHTVGIVSASAGRPSSAVSIFADLDSGVFEVALDEQVFGPGVTSLGSITRSANGCEAIFTLYEPPAVADLVEGADWELSVSWPNGSDNGS